MEYYTGKRREKAYRPVVLAAVFFTLIAAFIIVIMRPLALDAAVYRGKVVMTRHLQETVLEAIDDTVSYEDFVDVETDRGGEISAIRVNSAKIARLQAAMTKTLNEKLARWQTEEISISLGTLTGLWIFEGCGPYVSFYMSPVSTVKSQINHRFESAGINQTRHSIELELSVDAQTLAFGGRTPFNVSTRVVLSDTVVVGVAPNVYAQLASENR